MSSSPAVTSFFSPSTDPLATIGHQGRPPTFEWGQTHDITTDLLDAREGRDLPHSQDRTPPRDSASSASARKTTLQKLAFSPTPLVVSHQTAESIKSNPKSAAPREPYVLEGASGDTLNGGVHRRVSNRWSFNGAEPRIVNWELSEEIGKLSISNGASEGTDGTSTPPKNHTRDIVQIETSPLETSSSDTSLDSMAAVDNDALNPSSHSRGSSTDTTGSEYSSRSQLFGNSLKASAFSSDVTKDRPRSFSGAISDVELRRLQNIQTPGQLPEIGHERGASPLTHGYATETTKSSTTTSESGNLPAQPMFPSLAAYPTVHQPTAVNVPVGQGAPFAGRQEEHQLNANFHPRQHVEAQVPPHTFGPVPAGGPMRAQPDAMAFRLAARGLNVFQPPMQMPAQGPPPPVMSSPSNFPYPSLPNVHGHPSHLSLGNSQQLYDMMMAPIDPAVGRAQQSFRAGHQHSASDPASLRDAAALLLSNGVHNLQGMSFPPTPGLYPPVPVATPPLYPNQFFPGHGPQPQGVYGQDVMGAMGRSIPQYGANAAPPTQMAYSANNSTSPSSSNGPSANNRKLGLYKTELCRSWEEKGTCRYGPKCQFAHGEEEIRKVARHPKYKTEICRTFWVSGSCPYGKRCCFIHTELPASGAPPGAPASTDGNASPSTTNGRARSMSTNSDPNDVPVSLLARIAKRNQEAGSQGATTPTSSTPTETSNYQSFARPGSLRVDTNVLDSVGASKQNKSAYPTFVNTSVAAISPGPVTAGPDLGRHVGSNMNIMEVNQRLHRQGQQMPNPRQSLNGSEGLNHPRTVSGGSSPFGILSAEAPSSGTPSRHGHSRSGSASNWGSFSQMNHLAAPSPYTHTPSPANEVTGNGAASSPWGEHSAGANRINDRPWL